MSEGVRRLVLFDLDGTLLTGMAAERRLLLRLVSSGRLGPRHALAHLEFLFRYGLRHGRHTNKKNKAYAAGMSVAELEHLGAELAPTLADMLYRPALVRLRAHLYRGDHVVLLTGTPEFIAEPLGRLLGVGEVCASRWQSEAGRLLALPPAPHPFGEEKKRLAKQLAERRRLELSEGAAYANAIDDLPLLAAVGESVAVRPDRDLRAIAKSRGWEILDLPAKHASRRPRRAS